MNDLKSIKEYFDKENFLKLEKIPNSYLHAFLAKYVKLLNPSSVFVATDNEKDISYIKERAVKTGEEKTLNLKGHTVHFDGYYDQARDKEKTKFLLNNPEELSGFGINSILKTEGLNEIHELMNGIMKGKELFICFFSLGPTRSEFTIPAVQLTDSAYVAHSEFLLYRKGYDEFVLRGNNPDFFKFVHSAGELSDDMTSKNIDKRRIYIDRENSITFSINTQYGGNSIGLKKLALRLAIYKASKEGWLSEHMFLMGVSGKNGRKTYFTGAYPSMCGKTSTSMLPHESIVGDDIAYIREKNGKAFGVNVESGMFGIIYGVNEKDDKIVWRALHSENEIIFSNVLVGEDKKPYWSGMGVPIPEKGINFSGNWWKGKKDKNGNEIPPSHKNARFTLKLEILENVDKNLHNPEGVKIGGIIYGGRDSDTSNPVVEAFSWEHGIVTKGASLESETTAATLGKEGVRKFNPMANLDFLSIPIPLYVKINLDFGKKLSEKPKIFGVNYFLKDKNGNFLNDKLDKWIWIKWMEKRVHNEVKAKITPVGYIPIYEDLKHLFKTYLNREYTLKEYVEQFTLRVEENIRKNRRIYEIYKKFSDTPPILFEILDKEYQRLKEAKQNLGNYIDPAKFEIV